MTLYEYAPDRTDILDFIHQSIRQLQEAELEAHYILVGPEAYRHLRKAIGEAFGRGAGRFETYQHLPIVLDPDRGGRVVVLPAPAACAEGAQIFQVPA